MTPAFCSRLSPAKPSALLLYGIVFCFAAAKYLGAPWQRGYTIALYLALTAWAGAAMLPRILQRGRLLCRMDLLFGILIVAILVSAGVHWWEGTASRLQMMPFFVVLPYLLGRTMSAEDSYEFRNLLVGMGALLLLLIVPEYVHTYQFGYVHVNSPTPVLFARGHGVMLSGLVLSTAFVALISVVLSPGEPRGLAFLASPKGRYLAYALLAAIIVTVGWISSRGPAVTGVVGAVVLVLLMPGASKRRKIEILLVAVLATGIAAVQSLQRQSNASYYAALVQPPVAIGEADAPADEPQSLAAGTKGPILGERACKQIIDSVSDRWVHYEQAAMLFVKKPLFGVGANQYGFYSCSGPGAFPHSTILQVFAELGIFIGLAYCGLLVSTLRTFIRRIREPAGPASAAIWAWLASFAIVQFLLAQLIGDYFLSAPTYFVMGIAAGVEVSRRDAAPAEHRC